MRFKVIKPRGALPKFGLPVFVLVQDDWNDFSFQTLYHLYRVTGDGDTYIGAVKILKKGQTESDAQQITQDFESLNDEFVSVGQSLDYYQHLSELGPELRDEILDSLRDFVRYPELADSFRHELGWKTSIFRGFKENDEFLVVAKALLDSDYTSMPTQNLSFSFRMTGWEKPLDFNFSPPSVPPSAYLYPDITIPARIVAVIGKNGSGKSTFLARLARVAHGTTKNRELGLFTDLGEISPGGIGFPRIITVSYSAFDSFRLPGVAPRSPAEPDERMQIIKDVRKGDGRFIFCGLRDIASELEYQIQESKAGHLEDVFVGNDRLAQTMLKSIDVLANEFVETLKIVQRNGRDSLFNTALTTLIGDSSFPMEDADAVLETLLKDGAKEKFLSWSTGHKIVIQILASLSAHVMPRSLVLLDEPETHLHPPLLAALMHSVQHILVAQKAFAIVATHSPVVLQETLSQHVYIVRREGGVTDLNHPPIETFGENIGALTSAVFGLNSEVTDYHKVLDYLIQVCSGLDAIEKIFSPHGLSLQARAYVMSQLARKGAKG